MLLRRNTGFPFLPSYSSIDRKKILSKMHSSCRIRAFQSRKTHLGRHKKIFDFDGNGKGPSFLNRTKEVLFKPFKRMKIKHCFHIRYFLNFKKFRSFSEFVNTLEFLRQKCQKKPFLNTTFKMNGHF